MEIDAERADLAQQMFEAFSPLLSLMRSARTLSPGRMGILNTLSTEGRANAARMSHAIGVSQQAISLATKELESLGLIERQKDETDRRKTWFLITQTGKAKLDEEIRLGRNAIKQSIDENLTDQDIELIFAAIPALKKINTAVRP